MGTRTVYRIVVRGELSERYAIAFEGMEMEEHENRAPDTDGRVKTHKGEVSGRLETTDLASEQIARDMSGFRDAVSVDSNYHRGG
jgi:hypothetical protein